MLKRIFFYPKFTQFSPWTVWWTLPKIIGGDIFIFYSGFRRHGRFLWFRPMRDISSTAECMTIFPTKRASSVTGNGEEPGAVIL